MMIDRAIVLPVIVEFTVEHLFLDGSDNGLFD